MIEILHERESHDLHVQLWWDRYTGRVHVSVRDFNADQAYTVITDGEHALDAFYHPYCYLDTADLQAAA
jgi:hypothetical protein